MIQHVYYIRVTTIATPTWIGLCPTDYKVTDEPPGLTSRARKTSVPEGYQPALTANTSVRQTIVNRPPPASTANGCRGSELDGKIAWLRICWRLICNICRVVCKARFQFCGPRFIQIITRQMSAGRNARNSRCMSQCYRTHIAQLLAPSVRKLGTWFVIHPIWNSLVFEVPEFCHFSRLAFDVASVLQIDFDLLDHFFREVVIAVWKAFVASFQVDEGAAPTLRNHSEFSPTVKSHFVSPLVSPENSDSTFSGNKPISRPIVDSLISALSWRSIRRYSSPRSKHTVWLCRTLCYQVVNEDPYVSLVATQDNRRPSLESSGRIDSGYQTLGRSLFVTRSSIYLASQV